MWHKIRPARRCAVCGLLLAFVLSAALSGCARPTGDGPNGGTGSTSASPPAGGAVLPPLTVTRTGGMAGVRQRVAITPDGAWTFTDDRTGRTERGRLDDTARQRLARLVADPALAAETRGSAPPGTCADGYLYAIAAGELAIRYDDCGSAGHPRTADLVDLLTEATPL